MAKIEWLDILKQINLSLKPLQEQIESLSKRIEQLESNKQDKIDITMLDPRCKCDK
jgi:prefoldin subunit 5